MSLLIYDREESLQEECPYWTKVAVIGLGSALMVAVSAMLIQREPKKALLYAVASGLGTVGAAGIVNSIKLGLGLK